VRAIVDTGFLVALANRRDRHHQWAAELAEQLTTPLLTCDAVLAETAFHLASTSTVLALADEDLILPDFRIVEHVSRLKELAERYSDRSPDLADLCLIRMSELYPELPVVTTDVKDFRIYRRGHRQAIPLLHPPHL
jgi:predicted nucleic acid-binding protein